MAKRDEPRDENRKGAGLDPKLTKKGEHGIGRRAFVKLVGGAGAAVTAGVLSGEKLLAGTPEPQAAGVPMGKVVGPGPVPLTLRINGAAKKVALEPRVTLLDAMRDYLDLTGAKEVCDRATCGACTVIINGRATYSCTVLAIDVADRPGKPGADIRTIEGLAPAGQLHTVSAAFVENDAQQCGFCTPGFVMACKAFVDQHPNATREQVKHALGGNLCRCGTYMGIRQAGADAATKSKGGHA
jgi:xanthine dehydrogenase YagT iron-sulfur-binding subunit